VPATITSAQPRFINNPTHSRAAAAFESPTAIRTGNTPADAVTSTSLAKHGYILRLHALRAPAKRCSVCEIGRAGPSRYGTSTPRNVCQRTSCTGETFSTFTRRDWR
jgi:hypothetical protein